MIWGPFDRSLKQNPYPHYDQQMQERSLFVAPSNIVFSLDYQSVKYILNNEDDFRSTPPARGGKYTLPGFDRLMEQCLLTTDGQKQQQNRSFMADYFNLSEAEKSTETSTLSILDRLGDRPFDLIQELVQPVVAGTLMEILGIAPENRARAIEWSGRLLRSVDIFVTSKKYLEMEKASLAFESFVHRSIEDQTCGEFLEHVFNGLSEQESTTEALSKTASYTATLLFTGINTAVGLIGNIVHELLSKPKLGEEFQNMNSRQGEISSRALEELIRLCPSVHFTFRFASKATDIEDLHVKKDQIIALCLASANRDARVFEDPHRYLFDRNPNPHLSFGTGRHYCFGAKLARMQVKTVLSCLIDRLPNLQLSAEPTYMNYNFVRAPESLMIKAI
ncbi:MAG: cytochrome P450 [Roseivirga sp.]|nr:cytochrome P450 [Roseivirga sp.]